MMILNSFIRVARIVMAVVAVAGPAYAQQQTPADWVEPFPPFRIADNLYYVGSKGLAKLSDHHAAGSHSDQQRPRRQCAAHPREHREARIHVQRSNAQYPNIVKDYERTFAVLKSLPCDIPLGAHGSYFDLDVKYQKASTGDATAFIDPDGYKKNVASAEKDFLTELARQRALQVR